MVQTQRTRATGSAVRRRDTGNGRPDAGWTRVKIVAALRARRDRGGDLSSRAVQTSDTALAGAIARHFQSHH
jgi:hypothetical protein